MCLITESDDAYAWKVLLKKKYLFKKHMSKHSVEAYQELYWRVSISFEMILASETASSDAFDLFMLKFMINFHFTLFLQFETD